MAYQSKHTGKQIDDGIDAVSSKLGRTDDLTNNVVTFTEAEERTEIASGETAGTLFGKILKWLKSLGKVALSNDYNDLDNLPTIPEGGTTGDIPTKISDLEDDVGIITLKTNSPIIIDGKWYGSEQQYEAITELDGNIEYNIYNIEE